jgi:hypothetical protein
LQEKPIRIGAEAAEDIRRLVRGCPLFLADNIAEFFRSLSDGSRSHVASIAPPFPRFWVEYRDSPDADGLTLTHGFLFEAYSEPSGWQVVLVHLGGSSQLPHIVIFGSYTLKLDSQGSVVDIDVRLPEQLKKEAENGYLPLANFVHIALLTVTFLHCKNVARVEHVPDPALVKRSRERGNPVPLKYHTLEIEPMKEILRKEGQIEKVGLERALHICRGHFAHYAEDGPGLFGRGVHGDFWIPQHVRGTEKKGVVISDYNIHAPEVTK